MPERPHYRIYRNGNQRELVAPGSDGKVYIMPWGTNAWRQRRPFAGPAEGWERFARGAGYDVVGMVRGDRETNESQGQPLDRPGLRHFADRTKKYCRCPRRRPALFFTKL